ATGAAGQADAAAFWDAANTLQRRAPDGGPLVVDPDFKLWLDAEGRQDTRGVLELAGFDVRYLRPSIDRPLPSHQIYLLTCPTYFQARAEHAIIPLGKQPADACTLVRAAEAP